MAYNTELLYCSALTRKNRPCTRLVVRTDDASPHCAQHRDKNREASSKDQNENLGYLTDVPAHILTNAFHASDDRLLVQMACASKSLVRYFLPAMRRALDPRNVFRMLFERDVRLIHAIAERHAYGTYVSIHYFYPPVAPHLTLSIFSNHETYDGQVYIKLWDSFRHASTEIYPVMDDIVSVARSILDTSRSMPRELQRLQCHRHPYIQLCARIHAHVPSVLVEEDYRRLESQSYPPSYGKKHWSWPRRHLP